MCNLGSQVYCIGGWNGQYGIKQCDVYTPESNTWMTIAPLHVGEYDTDTFNREGSTIGMPNAK